MFEPGRARHVVAPQADASHADSVRIHIVAGFQVVDGRPGRDFGFREQLQIAQAQGLADTRVIDHQRGDTARGIGASQAGEIKELLHHIQAVKMDDAGRRAVADHGFGIRREEKAGQAGVVPIVAVGHLDPFNRAVLAFNALAEHVEHTFVSLDPDGVFGLTHALCCHVIDRRTFIFGAGAEPVSGGVVLVGQTLAALPEHHPAGMPRVVRGIIIGSRDGLEGFEGFVHFRKHGTGVDRHHGSHRPGVIVREIFEHHRGVLLFCVAGSDAP